MQSFESSQLSHYTPNYVYENFDMPVVNFFFGWGGGRGGFNMKKKEEQMLKFRIIE